MTSTVSSEQSAGEAVWAYLAEQEPDISPLDLSVLRLESGWLVQAAHDLGAERLIFLVNRHGFVEEVGSNSVSRRNAQRYLSDLGPVGAGRMVG